MKCSKVSLWLYMNTRWVMQFHALIYKIWINYAKPPRKIPVIISPQKRIWRPVVVSAGLIYLADVVCLHLGNVGGPLSPASSGNLADAPVQPITRKERPRAHNKFWSSPETLGISYVAHPPIQQIIYIMLLSDLENLLSVWENVLSIANVTLSREYCLQKKWKCDQF